jgi:uncharacterized Zn finger protein (UPF0148 family)
MEKLNVQIKAPPDGKCPKCGALLVLDTRDPDSIPRCPVHGTEYIEEEHHDAT